MSRVWFQNPKVGVPGGECIFRVVCSNDCSRCKHNNNNNYNNIRSAFAHHPAAPDTRESRTTVGEYRTNRGSNDG